MIHTNPYQRYHQAVVEALDNSAGLDETLTDVPKGGRAAFILAANFIHGEAIAHHGSELPKRFDTDEVAHGMRVMARFVLYGMKRLAREQASMQTVLHVLLHPETFDNTLAPLAEEITDVASRVERDYGLRAESNNAHPEILYMLADDSLSFPMLPLQMCEVRQELAERGEQLRPNGICGAHKTAVLKALYTSIVPTIVEHPSLGGTLVVNPGFSTVLA